MAMCPGKKQGFYSRKGEIWILGYYQQYMPFKLIQKLYVQSHQETKGKFGLMFFIRTYNNMLKINRSMKH